MSNQLSVWSAMRINAQMQANAAASSTKIGTNQAGNTASSWGSDPNIAIRPGSTRYNAIAVTASRSSRSAIRRRAWPCGAARSTESVMHLQRSP